MGVVIKQSFWGTTIAYLGVLIGYFNTLYFRAEHFDLSQIGIFALITANAMMISPFSSFGTHSSFIKFFPAFRKEDQNRFFTFLLSIAFITNAIIIAVGYLLKTQIAERYTETAPLYVDFLMVTAIIIVVNSLFELFFSYSRAIMRVVFPTFLREIFLRAGSLLLVAGFAFNWWSFSGAVFGLGILYSAAFCFLLIQLVILHHFKLDFRFNIIDSVWRRKLLDFGIYSMIIAGSFAVMNNISYDQITAMIGTEATGIFNTCFFIAVIVEMPRRNMAKIITPLLSAEFQNNNLVEVKNLYQKSSITLATIGALIFIGIITNLGDLFAFIPKGDSFSTGFWVVIAICLAKFCLMISSFSAEIINFSSYYKYNIIFQVGGMLLLIGLNVLFIPIFGINGAALAYVCSILAQIISRLLFVKHKFGISPFVNKHLTLMIVLLVIGAGAFLLNPSFHPIINIGIRSFFTTILFVFAIYKLHISSDINKIIRSTFEQVKNIFAR